MFLREENAIKSVNRCLLIFKALKIQDGCQIYRQQNVLATDVPFKLMLNKVFLTLKKCPCNKV